MTGSEFYGLWEVNIYNGLFWFKWKRAGPQQQDEIQHYCSWRITGNNRVNAYAWRNHGVQQSLYPIETLPLSEVSLLQQCSFHGYGVGLINETFVELGFNYWDGQLLCY